MVILVFKTKVLKMKDRFQFPKISLVSSLVWSIEFINFCAFVSIFLLCACATVSTAPSDESIPTLLKPRDRFPVHFKFGENGVKKINSDEIIGSRSGISTKLPPITELNLSDDLKVRPTVKIFEIGTAPTVASPPLQRFQIQKISSKSLLDESESLRKDDPRLSDQNNETDDTISDDEDPTIEPLGQETYFGGIFGIQPTGRKSYTYRQKPKNHLSLVGNQSLKPIPSTVMVPTRPPVIGPPAIRVTEVPILGFGPSPSVSNILPPAPPPNTFRSLFGNRQVLPLTSRKVQNKEITTNRFSENNGAEADESDSNVITDFVFSEIKCYRTKQTEYFGAKIHMKNGYHVPYIRARPDDPLTSSECHLDKTRDPNTFHMKMSDLRGCGVEQCGDSMCVTMVFPRVPTLALADDEVTTIKCLPQKSSMAEMKTISFAGDTLENRRSGSTVEGGGQEFAAEVGVFRQNPGTSNGLFAKRVNSGGVVQLGEPLQLRSVVRGGDGWTFSKLTDVKVWRMRDTYSPTNINQILNPGDASEVITLVDSKGCRNEEYRVIAESDPLRDPRNDLVHHFTFNAFLFRGQRANEPLIVTAKVQACQERDDCDITDCGMTRGSDDVGRYKRSLLDDTSSPLPAKNGTLMNWSSHLALRVVGLKDHPSPVSEFDFGTDSSRVVPESYACAEKIGAGVFAGIFLMLLLSILVFTLANFCRKGKEIESKIIKRKSDLHQSRPLPSTKVSNVADYVRQPLNQETQLKSNSGRANKPLPPIPLDSATNNQTHVANLLHQLAEARAQEDYECVQNESSVLKSSKLCTKEEDDGVYVLYYCNNNKRSKSAPASLRKKNQDLKRGIVTDIDTGDSEDEQESFDQSEHRQRRTVRSIKKRSHKRKKIKERNVIPDTLLQNQHNNRSGGRRSLGGSTTSIHLNHGGESESSYSDSQVLSDSAYSSTSTTSKQAPFFKPLKTNNTTHFVTRNDSSTQIIIIPETNV